jgi:hypothetical protein
VQAQAQTRHDTTHPYKGVGLSRCRGAPNGMEELEFMIEKEISMDDRAMQTMRKPRTYRPRKIHAKKCAHCRREFKPLRRDAKYCSDPCKSAAYRVRVIVRRWGYLSRWVLK